MPSFSCPGSLLRRVLLATILLAAGGLLAPGRASAQLLLPLDELAATLDRATVPAAGRHHTLLTVKRFGRYAVTVDSEQGVALQLVDRMAGPGEIMGRAGVITDSAANAALLAQFWVREPVTTGNNQPPLP